MIEQPMQLVKVPPAPAPEPPLALLAEVTHRCPLACPYCSNPLALDPRDVEMSTGEWRGILEQAAALGVVQVHFSGGEPCARHDIEELVAHASAIGLYSNLITSAVSLDKARIERLRDFGLSHVQISFQDSRADSNDKIAGFRNAFVRKSEAARNVVAAGMALTVNAVVQRANIDRVDEFIDLALALGASRIEIANVQYYGWALVNRAALLPTLEQLTRMDGRVRSRLPELRGRLVVDYVVPDWHASRPKACMGGWARRFMNVTPRGRVLPCHAAETIPGMVFETVHDRPLADIWRDGEAFQRYRGTGWMKEPCSSCDRREIDWGGCRCQALALAGDAAATDPVCHLSPDHAKVKALVTEIAAAAPHIPTDPATGIPAFVARPAPPASTPVSS